MEGDPKAAVEAVEQDRSPRNRGIGLCLSGGGFRATLFHLGAIQRLFELGIATSPDFDTVASVSGGSLTCAQWAIAEAPRKGTVAEGSVTVPVDPPSTSHATSHAQS